MNCTVRVRAGGSPNGWTIDQPRGSNPISRFVTVSSRSWRDENPPNKPCPGFQFDSLRVMP